MKPTKLIILTATAMLVLACSARAVSITFPLVKLSISGTASYNADSPTNNGTTTKSALTTVSINTKSLIALLNASPVASNTISHVTGTSQIPAGSYFLYNVGGSAGNNGKLIVTNKNGFSFALNGTDPVTTTNYSYGSLNIHATHLIGSFKQNDTTGAGSERDLTGIVLSFNDSNGNSLADYGNGTLKWNFGKVSGGVQETTLKIDFPLPNGFADMVNYKNAVAENVKASGKAKGDVPSDIFPFYLPVP